ncbi:histone-lysine N-methyltransferase SETMAR [Trichonephila clavipes]|uniref:Histone-lysine N-methyltransferase SETMAR n=1 Tax=Trichonephila clavipes TaxID=2585209 RepID=A0A8X6UZD5_TRICX|nr:histone-lysine N-methyltransferase SETMAR [Trichonephila clavipes]
MSSGNSLPQFNLRVRGGKKGGSHNLFGEAVVTARTCQRCLVKFCLDDFSSTDEPISGSPADDIDEVQRSMTSINPTLTSTEVGFKLGVNQTTALDYIKMLGFVSELYVCVSHDLSIKKLMYKISICS